MYHTFVTTLLFITIYKSQVLADNTAPTSPPLASALSSAPNGGVWSSAMASGSGGGPSLEPPPGCLFIPPSTDVSKRDIGSIQKFVKRQLANNPNFLYQISPHVLSTQTLRSFTGAIIPTYDTVDAILNGRGQVALSHGQRDFQGACNSSAPIQLYSGLGNTVTIIRGDIPYDGGYIHLVSE